MRYERSEHASAQAGARGPKLNPELLRQRQRQLALARATLAVAPPVRAMRAMRARPGPLALASSTLRGPGSAEPRARRRGAPVQHWWLAIRARPTRAQPAPTPAPAPARWLGTFRRWSPGIVPPLLGTALLLLAFALANRRDARGAPSLSPGELTALFIIYLVGAGAYGVALYVAPSLAIWLLVLIGGVVVYAGVTLWVASGALVAVAFAVFAAAAGVYYVRARMLSVPDGRVAVTALAGGYLRSLRPGGAVLLPGERVLATVETGERQYSCPAKQARVRDSDDTAYIARATATVGYHALPAQAHLAALGSDDWERDLRDLIATTLRESLVKWAHTMLDEEAAAPDRLLARTMLAMLREQARVRGIHIQWVGVKDIWLMPESETIPANLADDLDQGEDEDEQPPTRATAARAPLEAGPTPATASAAAPSAAATVAPRMLPAIGDVSGQSGPPPLPLPDEALAPEALSDAYDAVREGRIYDPATIRDIAQAFLLVAADEQRHTDFPYDAVAAARILMDRAATLERDNRPAGGVRR
jgi:hypothetical protein